MEFFPYEIDRRWAALFAVLRVKETDGVELTDDGMFRAVFGRSHVDTPISNVMEAKVTGPHRWFKAVGLRQSLSNDGLTFGTNHRRGVMVEFVERVPKVVGLRDHSSLWVSVADPDGLVAALTR